MILDIETFSLDDAAAFIEEPSAPANYKDPEKIAAFIADARAKAVSRCALDPDLCRIVAVGWDLNDAQGCTCFKDANEEADGLRQFWALASRSHRLIGFNLLGFDLPVLIRRSQYLDVEVPSTAYNLDRYRSPHVDLMERLSFNGKVKAHSLEFYRRRFALDVPDDPYTGADVNALVLDGNWSAVADHCFADVLTTKALAIRLGVIAPVAEAV